MTAKEHDEESMEIILEDIRSFFNKEENFNSLYHFYKFDKAVAVRCSNDVRNTRLFESQVTSWNKTWRISVRTKY